MANQCFVLIVVIALLVMGSPLAVMGNVDVIFYSNLTAYKLVMMHCWSTLGGHLPASIFGPKQVFLDYRKRNWGGIRYLCEFQGQEKPTTTFNVFVGTGGPSNQPCECTGKYCQWTINEEGISCDSNDYIHNWG